MTVAVTNPEELDKHRSYTIATWDGTLTARFGGSALPQPWYVYYDQTNRTARLSAVVGTVIKMR
jgi:hypothetical protein